MAFQADRGIPIGHVLGIIRIHASNLFVRPVPVSVIHSLLCLPPLSGRSFDSAIRLD